MPIIVIIIDPRCYTWWAQSVKFTGESPFILKSFAQVVIMQFNSVCRL